MDPSLLLLLVGFFYVVIFGGLTLLRRENLSGQFALEAVVLTLLASGLSWLGVISLNLVFFLVLLYLVTMRVRILVDLANFFARRGSYGRSASLYRLAENVWPDQTSRAIIGVNYSASLIQQGELEQAVELLKNSLALAGQGYLGVKYEAAAHFNLGVAYRRLQMNAQSVTEFNRVLEVWPVSDYAQRAEDALQVGRRRLDDPSPSEEESSG